MGTKLLTPLPKGEDGQAIHKGTGKMKRLIRKPVNQAPHFLMNNDPNGMVSGTLEEVVKSILSPEESKDLSEIKGRFKCKACSLSFVSKKMYDKHRKTGEHKVKEKLYR